MITQTTSTPKIWHILIGGSIGNLTEWYNFLLYGYLASVISQLFFPLKNPLLSLTLTFTVFALSFLARPLGGILFGWIGDTYGRQRALVAALILMAIPTLIIGFLPTFASIGIASPVILCLARICQGLSAGGEHTGSAVYLAEYAPATKRTLWISIVPTTASLGVLFSSIMSLVLINSFTQQELLAGGWRVGYWIGAGLCFISILLRLNLPETPDFKAAHKEKYPLAKLLKDPRSRKHLFTVFSLASTWGIVYQILFIWMPTYLTHVQHLSHRSALQINCVCLVCLAIFISLVGYWADHINRTRLIRLSCLAMLIFSYPLFLLLASGSLLQIYPAMAIFTLIFSLYLPTAFASMIELFSTDIRYTGMSLGFNLGLAIFGGTCPLIVTWLIEWTTNPKAPACYLIVAALSGFVTSMRISDKKGQLVIHTPLTTRHS